MRFGVLNCLILITGFPVHTFSLLDKDETSVIEQKLLSRKKRYLNFPDGSVLQLAYCLQLGGLFRPDLIFGYTIGTNWDLPSGNFYKHHPGNNNNGKDIHRRHRRDLYKKLEPILTIMGLDGRACILRTLCESGRRPKTKGSFMEELLYAIFTLPASDTPEDDDESYRMYDKAHRTSRDCSSLFPSCPSSLLQPSTLIM